MIMENGSQENGNNAEINLDFFLLNKFIRLYEGWLFFSYKQSLPRKCVIEGRLNALNDIWRC